ncbi:MAG: GTPase Era [Deltaproteobacteria bacterium]|nr:GTPase Era [Deltaproteobacteria bacterium]
MNSDKQKFLSGFVAIVGPPNVGKSTLLNRLLGTKVAIVSPKPQTTRKRILGIYHGDGYQVAFMDTPGIHKTRTLLHKSMVASAQEALHEVDIIIMIIEMPRPDDPDIPLILKNLEQTRKPSFLIINKIDTGSKKELLPIIESFSRLNLFDAVIPISALKGKGIEQVMKQLHSRLKPGPAFFPKDMKTDQSDSFLVSEMIREKIFLHTRQELPYSSAVTVDRMEDKPEKNLLTVTARIHVESDSQKGMLIGQKGRMIKAIGQSARRELEKIFEARIFLDLTVHVEKNWSRDTRALRRLGY